ncbi:hypothetical protein CAAN3_03S07558 [[Candida] anglica]
MATSQVHRSVVQEYSILYSSRLKQKSKNWQDGILKFYHFNNRIDIHNGEGHLIASDFFPPSRLPSRIETEYLKEGNEFKLPNGNILIEMDEKLECYERDVSNMFKRTDATPNPEVKIKYENDTPINTMRKLNDESRLKGTVEKENRSIQELTSSQIKRRPIGLQRKKLHRVNVNTPPSPIIEISNNNTKQLENNSIVKVSPIEPKIEAQDEVIRIPAKSSTHFKYLCKNPLQLPMQDFGSCVVGGSRSMSMDFKGEDEPVVATQHELYEDVSDEEPIADKNTVITAVERSTIPYGSELQGMRSSQMQCTNQNAVKQEVVVVKEGPSKQCKVNELNKADIIYDLSDMEEDMQFAEMVGNITTFANP